MSWNNGNGQQQQNGGGYNGPRQARKIPELGKGRLRKTQKKTDKSPDFKGLVNFEGHIIDLALWYEAPRASGDGQQMGESWSVKATRYDPNAQQQQGVSQQTTMQYPPPAQYGQPVYAQQAPGPAYAPSPQPPQHGGYAPAPGYQPPPPAQPPQAPQWGGQPAQGRPPQAQGGFQKNEVPF